MDLNSILFAALLAIATGIISGLVVMILSHATEYKFFVKAPKKELTSTVIWRSSLAKVAENYEHEFELYWRGERLGTPNVFQTVIQFENTGTEPILVSDYDTPISLRLASGNGNILSVGYDSEGLPITTSYSQGGDSVIIEPLLLNSGDVFAVSLVINDDSKILIGGRIVGVSEIKILHKPKYMEIRSRQAQMQMIVYAAVIGIVLGAFAFMLYIFIQNRP